MMQRQARGRSKERGMLPSRAAQVWRGSNAIYPAKSAISRVMCWSKKSISVLMPLPGCGYESIRSMTRVAPERVEKLNFAAFF
jgi:hypothetical protein